MNALLTTLSLFLGMLFIMFVIIPVGICMFLIAYKIYNWIFDMFGF